MNDEDGRFDWDLLMRFGLGVLGLGPREFWSMTPREFDAAVKGKMGVFGEARPFGRDNLAALSAQYPDKVAS